MNLKSTIERHFSGLYSIGFIIGLVFCFIYAQNQILTGDQTQMLYKGYLGAYQDVWLSYGNAASAVGNVPGSLSTWLIGGPLLVWDSPWSPMVLLLALRVVSLILLDNVIKTVFADNHVKLARLLLVVLYWLNPWFLYDSLLYNPSYLCLFATMHLWSAIKMRETKSFWYSFIHVLAIGLAMQLHYSWPILAVISVYLFYRQMGHISWFGVFAAVAAILASLIPYFQELAVNDAIQRESDRYIGYGLVHVYPVLKALLYWLRYGSMLFSNKVIAYSEFDWLTQIEWLKLTALALWKTFIFVIGAVSVIVSARLNWLWWKRVKPAIKRGSDITSNVQWIELYAFGAVVGVLISAALSPITFSYWHLILVYPFAIIPILIGIHSLLTSEDKAQHGAAPSGPKFIQNKPKVQALLLNFSEPNKASRLLLIALGYLLTINLLASQDSIKYSYKAEYATQTEQYLLDNQLLPKKSN
ncbi:3-deoxy-D-manno-octulosonic acid transferase [Vibrio mediterranei]|uniref:3-deoxy-D-manno-octulosonic acid transferase n=1 Tax=Vibrio mediterranei TaxID=689 RepID=UPI00148C027D|nr:3-deoxy-D-manno-octulosonic acid transferase [Vibrio mediterranei]MCG9626011.1 3-deoxy-D-manno-octulosonic acid transferase [Vibrio mediterranei]MCG9666172.1 3-deoxy-D-manno-octulosonic acid transferase [Vibrio mediterranei]NOI24433.1 3-deoxy-D-manno-octulosonic acid transferase [Vibrio mediterranei]